MTHRALIELIANSSLDEPDLTTCQSSVVAAAAAANASVGNASAASCFRAPEEVARQCGLSRRAVYRAIERGELRASRPCSRIRIRAADVKAWVEEDQIEPAPQ
jgi:excisionase family DNA binding protein